MNFLDFVEKRNKDLQHKETINEAFKNSDLGKARDLIVKLLRKESGKKVLSLGNFDIEIKSEQYTSELFICSEQGSNICFTFNWLNSATSSEIHSISFFKNMNVFFTGYGKADLTLMTMGASIVYFLPVIAHILSTQDLHLTIADTLKYSKNVFGNSNVKESQFYYGALKHVIYEGLSSEVINNTFNYIVNENDYEDMIAWKKQHYEATKDAYANRNTSKEAKELSKRLTAEYEEIKKAIKGGATSINEVKIAIDRALTIKVKDNKSIIDAQKQLEKEQKDPDQTFKEMIKYVNMVIKGTVPALIVSGGPGLGKTYKIKRALKAGGYEEDVNLTTIKGKCSLRRLYIELFNMKNNGDILLIDDADGLVGPKAPEDCINLLKAALDSTADDEGRLITYGVASKILDDNGNELPKKFYYNGGCIVITNYNIGQINTALRGRSYVKDIDFTTEQVLLVIKRLMPAIEPEKLSAKAKMKAYDFLMEMVENKEQMQLSIRTFGLCATIFDACMNDNDFNDDDAKSMIREQMELQSLSGGKSY